MKFDDFLKAINSNDIKLVKDFLSNKDFDPSLNNNEAFVQAFLKGKVDIVKLFLNDKRINPADQDNKAFICSCYNEYFDIVKLLFNDKRINPTDQNNDAFIENCTNRRIELIKLFIENNVYNFEFDYNQKDYLYFLKIIYPTLKNDVEQYLIDIGKEEELIELKKSFVSNNISRF